MERPDDACEPGPEARSRPEPDPEAVERAGAVMQALLAELPETRPWTRRPTPASNPSTPE